MEGIGREEDLMSVDLGAVADLARNCWLRSANRSNANNAWYVNASGNANNNNANNGNYAAPDCAGIRLDKASPKGWSSQNRRRRERRSCARKGQTNAR